MTYINEKPQAYVQPLADRLEDPICIKLDVNQPEEQDALFETIIEKWGKRDFLLHTIAFALKADLQGRVLAFVKCSLFKTLRKKNIF